MRWQLYDMYELATVLYCWGRPKGLGGQAARAKPLVCQFRVGAASTAVGETDPAWARLPTSEDGALLR